MGGLAVERMHKSGRKCTLAGLPSDRACCCGTVGRQGRCCPVSAPLLLHGPLNSTAIQRPHPPALNPAGAVHLTTPEGVQAFLASWPEEHWARTALVFHCEFSTERGPRAAKFVRNKVGRTRRARAGPASGTCVDRQ